MYKFHVEKTVESRTGTHWFKKWRKWHRHRRFSDESGTSTGTGEKIDESGTGDSGYARDHELKKNALMGADSFEMKKVN